MKIFKLINETMKMIFICITIFFVNANAQFSQSFSNIAHIHDQGSTFGVAISTNRTIFSANGIDGLWAYSFNDTAFSYINHVDDGGIAHSVAVNSNGIVFLANGDSGLWAYSFINGIFIYSSHIIAGNGGVARDLVLSQDGTIFLANGSDGLRAFTYDGSSFTNTAHININGFADGVAISPEGIIFIAAGDTGSWALSSYIYNGTNFTNITHCNRKGRAHSVAANHNGSVFLAHGPEGLWTFTYTDSSLTCITQADSGNWPAGWATGVSMGPCGTVFLANNFDGLRAFTLKDTLLTNTAHIDNGGHAHDVAIDTDGKIFLANGEDGLRAYTYSGLTGIENSTYEIISNLTLFQNFPNPFNTKTKIKYQLSNTKSIDLSIYTILGEKIIILFSGEQQAGIYEFEWDASGYASGIYLYRIKYQDDIFLTKKLLLLK